MTSLHIGYAYVDLCAKTIAYVDTIIYSSDDVTHLKDPPPSPQRHDDTSLSVVVLGGAIGGGANAQIAKLTP